MKITAIRRQQKNAGRYSIYIDEKYEFSLTEQQFVESRIHVGLALTAEEIKNYKQKSDFGKLYERALKWLAIRPRSKWELDTYLTKITKNEEHKNKIAAKLQKLGFIDDKKFAESWINSRHILKATSRRKLWVELKQKRVPNDVIEDSLAADETDEVEVLKDLIKRKSKQSQYSDREKLMAYLTRQGFRYDQIKQALEEVEQ